MRRTRKELKAEIRLLRQERDELVVGLREEQQKFVAVNDRCGKAIVAINAARDTLSNWPHPKGAEA